jgi:hypothetical protein
MMKRMLMLAFAALSLPVHANGGGYLRGGVTRAGDIAGFEPKSTEHIRLLDEKLTVDLGSAEAAVDIQYRMRNETGKKVKVRFGFPVEESFDVANIGVPEAEAARKPDQLRYCRDYAITAGGAPLKASWKAEQNSSSDPRFNGIAGWLVSEITFAAGEEKPVRIRFRSSYPREIWSVSENGHKSTGLFRYRLSTAACWAGTIGTGRIEFRPSGIAPEDLRVLKPVNRFKKQGDSWVWEFQDLEPTLADDLEIEAQPAVRFRRAEGGNQYVQRGERWTMAHTNYRVKASSTLPPDGGLSYSADQVKSHGGSWSEGAPGPGVGEWLELQPEVAKPLDAIEIEPGYTKTEELFQANARPKKVRIELNGEHRFTADVPDSKEPCRIAVSSYRKPVKTIRLTFEDVWPGTQHEDLCISRIRLHARLDKEPEIQPSR